MNNKRKPRYERHPDERTSSREQDVMSDQEYAEDEERKERIRNQREYEGDYD
jgi:hypothetical protein